MSLSVCPCLCDRGIVPKSEEKKFLAEMDELNKVKFQLEDALVDEEEAEKEGVDPETVHTHTLICQCWILTLLFAIQDLHPYIILQYVLSSKLLVFIEVRRMLSDVLHS